MIATTQDVKALRGTKRVCQACETRFYDLKRDPMVCPSCGAQFALAAMPVVEISIREAPQTSKTAWRNARPKRPEPAPPEAPSSAARSTEELEDGDEPVPEVEAVEEDDTVLEPEVDEADVTGLIDHDVAEPKER